MTLQCGWAKGLICTQILGRLQGIIPGVRPVDIDFLSEIDRCNMPWTLLYSHREFDITV